MSVRSGAGAAGLSSRPETAPRILTLAVLPVALVPDIVAVAAMGAGAASTATASISS